MLPKIFAVNTLGMFTSICQNNVNQSGIPDFVFEIYCEMWESGETYCHGVSKI